LLFYRSFKWDLNNTSKIGLAMTIQKFENLEVWKNARELCIKIREIINTTSLGKDYSIKDQILR